eukprot:gnl/TRDRNA2_/TRDRNA2_132912_c0_seq3.p1 gnl/TRDRNA2_/TRDRNA2_132912_c0~~gnl/TRDRNA2_/TRDRNA2_132912_c0_seq3.p1  ORF type:complete len:128 (+),score=12.34 gnl/TRDRNA2_/TRDRNA2_132912_c0_seq3:45-386(+)
MSGDVLWCNRCGAYASLRAQGLSRACPRRPSDGAAARRLRLLREGRHPVTRTCLEDDVFRGRQSQAARRREFHRQEAAPALTAAERMAALRERVRARERLARAAGVACQFERL